MFLVQSSNSKMNFLQKLVPRVAELGRFFTVGIANTLITIGIYQLLLTGFGPLWSYAVAWPAGIVIVATVYPRAVYRVSAGAAARVAMVGLYVTVFVIGFLLTRGLDDLGLPARLTIFAVAAVTAALSYFGGRLVLQTRFWT